MIDWLACLFVKVIGGLLCRLPPSVAVWIGERLGRLAYWLQPKRTRIGVLNLRAAFDGALTPSQARDIILACYRQIGAGIIELLRLPVINHAYVERYIAIDGRAHIKQAIASGRPVMFLTGHYGNWELCSIVAALIGTPIVALARAQQKLPRLYQLLISYRESKGCTIVHKGGAMRRLVEALRRRRPIGIVGDQASRQGLCIDFFGRPALFAKGPFELAYAEGALILPSFIRRLRGPFHRLVIDPPISLSREAPKDEAVRLGIEQFAAILSRHIREEPDQWLWMHKRWKHTPARRALVLSDGKAGHLKQSLAVVEALRDQHPDTTHQVVEVRFRHRAARVVTLLWSWWMPGRAGATRCLQWALSPQARAALLSRYADVVVSCGSSLAPVNLLWAGEHQAKSVVIMNPAPLPVSRFHLVIAPWHDRLPQRANIVRLTGAIGSRLREDDLRQARDRLRVHPKFRPIPDMPSTRPVLGLFVGGETPEYEFGAAEAEALIAQVIGACEAIDGWCLVTTSRRTSQVVERLFAERLESHPRCRFVLIANQDSVDGAMEGMLGASDVAIVTGESVSMVSEACASGRRVIVIEPRAKRRAGFTPRKHQRFLRSLVEAGHMRLAPLSELSVAIQRVVTTPQSPVCLEHFGIVREAAARLL